MKENPLDHLRAICLAYPEATEQGGVGNPSFKVRDKIFAMQHRVDDRPSIWCKAPPGLQDILVNSNPERFFIPPYVGHHGWVGIWLDLEIDWDEVADLVEESYRMAAPKRLRVLLDQSYILLKLPEVTKYGRRAFITFQFLLIFQFNHV